MFLHLFFVLRGDGVHFFVDPMDKPEEEWGVTFLLDKLLLLFYDFEKVLYDMPDFFIVLIVESCAHFVGEVPHCCPLFLFFSLDHSLLIIIPVVIKDILRGKG